MATGGVHLVLYALLHVSDSAIACCAGGELVGGFPGVTNLLHLFYLIGFGSHVITMSENPSRGPSPPLTSPFRTISLQTTWVVYLSVALFAAERRSNVPRGPRKYRVTACSCVTLGKNRTVLAWTKVVLIATVPTRLKSLGKKASLGTYKCSAYNGLGWPLDRAVR